jgi:hypothetical protein
VPPDLNNDNKDDKDSWDKVVDDVVGIVSGSFVLVALTMDGKQNNSRQYYAEL